MHTLNHIIALCAVGFLLVSCGRPPTAANSPPAVPPAPPTGIHGVARLRFLPNPVNGGGAPVSITPLADRTITARGPGLDPSKPPETKTAADGHFFITVPPGDYEVLLHAAYGDGIDSVSKVTVEAGKEGQEIVLQTELAQP